MISATAMCSDTVTGHSLFTFCFRVSMQDRKGVFSLGPVIRSACNRASEVHTEARLRGRGDGSLHGCAIIPPAPGDCQVTVPVDLADVRGSPPGSTPRRWAWAESFATEFLDGDSPAGPLRRFCRDGNPVQPGHRRTLAETIRVAF